MTSNKPNYGGKFFDDFLIFIIWGLLPGIATYRYPFKVSPMCHNFKVKVAQKNLVTPVLGVTSWEGSECTTYTYIKAFYM